MQNLFSAYRYQRLSLSLAWKGRSAGTGFSADIGMRGPPARERSGSFPFRVKFLFGGALSKLV